MGVEEVREGRMAWIGLDYPPPRGSRQARALENRSLGDGEGEASMYIYLRYLQR